MVYQKIRQFVATDKTIFSAPEQPVYFVGREQLITKITQHLLKKEPVLIVGPAGIGKTTLAIKIAHLLRSQFTDGVLWYRYDIKGIYNILNDIAQLYGRNINNIDDIKIKSSIVKSILAKKNILLILDNVNKTDGINYLLPDKKNHFSIIMTSKRTDFINKEIKIIKTPYFDEREATLLCSKILGLVYVANNFKTIKLINKFFGYLPLAINIFIKQALFLPTKITTYLQQLKQEKLQLEKFAYDNKNLLLSLNFSFNNLTLSEKNFFISLGVFEGVDLSLEASAFINNLKLKEAKKYLDRLEELSLVEKSIIQRYRLHSLIKVFTQKKVSNPKIYDTLVLYYINFLEKGRRGNTKFYPQIEIELENITGAIKKCYQLRLCKNLCKLWNYFGVFLWDSGRWYSVKKYGKIICHASCIEKDLYNQALILIRELSWVFFWQGDAQEAEKLAEKGSAIAKKLNDSYLKAYADQRLGKIYLSDPSKLQQSLSAFQQSLKYFTRINDQERIGDTLTYIGENYLLQKNLNEAQNYLHQALAIVNRINDINQKAIIYNRLGALNILKGDYIKAEEIFNKSLQLELYSGRRAGSEIWSNIGLGLIYENKEKQEEANALFKKAKEEMAYLGMNKNMDKNSTFLSIVREQLVKSSFKNLKNN